MTKFLNQSCGQWEGTQDRGDVVSLSAGSEANSRILNQPQALDRKSMQSHIQRVAMIKTRRHKGMYRLLQIYRRQVGFDFSD